MRILKVKWVVALTLALSLVLSSAAYVTAGGGGGGVGTIRIDPALPAMVGPTATFTVWVQPSADPTKDPHIFLVMTESCYNGLPDGDGVTLDWKGDGTPELTISKADWKRETINSKKLPDGVDITNGAGYTVASLKDHLGTTEPIYWVFKSFLDGKDLTVTPKQFTVTLPSTSPRMLVYVLGKTGGGTPFNNRVPPTIPGFVVPEPSTIVAVVASLATLGGYAVRRRKH